MGKRIAAVDAYIARSKPFARPILVHLRDVVHAAAPAADEAIKWGMPFFEYKGLLCYMAAFKAHAAFGFYRHAALAKESRLPAAFDRSAMGSFGRLTAVGQLPPRRVLAALVKLAMKLADEREEVAGKRKAKPRAKAKPAAKRQPAKRAKPASRGAAKKRRPAAR
jgi:hypothetical protein